MTAISEASIEPGAPAMNRRTRVLLALTSDEEGLTLSDIGACLGDSGQVAARLRAETLKKLRSDGLVEYRRPKGSRGYGGGAYVLTTTGAEAVEHLRGTCAAVTLATGAMAGESGVVLWTKALPGQAPVRSLNWIFGLGL